MLPYDGEKEIIMHTEVPEAEVSGDTKAGGGKDDKGREGKNGCRKDCLTEWRMTS